MSTEVNNEKDLWPNNVIVKLENAFIDERGSIQPLVDLPMKSCVMISSKKGSIRANHYHKTDWHFCYVVSGQIEYHYKPHDSDEDKKILVIKKGELFFTPPMVDHAMLFTEDTIFLTMGRNSRKQEIYEEDIESVELVK
jgi:dTDP-4-dehydrorhamnose 3,5-epimerase-like enzyme